MTGESRGYIKERYPPYSKPDRIARTFGERWEVGWGGVFKLPVLECWHAHEAHQTARQSSEYRRAAPYHGFLRYILSKDSLLGADAGI